MFFADEWAQDVRDEHDPPYVVRAGWSPSGAPHPGHLQELLCASYVAQALDGELRIGIDDRDALRSVPTVLHDGEQEQAGPFEIEDEIGRPLVSVGDPFGCCDSFAAHNRRLLEDVLNRLSIEATVVSMDEQWRNGVLDESLETIREHWGSLRSILGEHQANPPRTYVRPICGRCGRIAVGQSISGSDVSYRCEGDHERGCGHEGTQALRNSSLPWRLRWPLQWQTSGACFEPYGRDHESSVASGRAIAQALGWTVPTLRRYEWWSVDGKACSSSEGSLTLPRLLDYLPANVARWLSSRNPRRSHPVSLDDVPRYIEQFREEYDRGERGARMAATEDVVRLDWGTAVHAGCLPGDDQRLGYLRAVGCDVEETEQAPLLRFVESAYRYARDHQSDQYHELGTGTATNHPSFVQAVADIEGVNGADEWGERLREVAEEHGLSFGEACTALYQQLFGTTSGPRLAPLLAQFSPDDMRAFVAFGSD